MDLSRTAQWARAVDRRRPLLWDVALAVVVAAISVVATRGVSRASLVTLVLTHGALVLRRRRPYPALLAGAAGVLLGDALALLLGVDPPWAHLALWVMLFDVGLRERGRRVAVSCGVVILAVAASVLPPAGAGALNGGDQLRTSTAALAMSAASVLLGLQIRTRREHVAAQRAEAARVAVVAERSRIAQEMHDIIGHNLSVITSLANGGAVAVRTSPDAAVHAFEAIGAVSRSSVREVARVLTVLRHDHSPDGSPLAPQPGLADVDGLVASTRAAGVPITVEHEGDLGDLSAGRQLAVYRIVQESLTNVLRHAGPGASARVRIVRDDRAVRVTVDDDGGSGGRPAGVATSGTMGHGTLGMRERTEAFGGRLDAGPSGGGWRVDALIPSDDDEARGESR